MADIIVSEFMDEEAIADLGVGRDVLYNPALVDDETSLHATLQHARAIVVRNRTQVRGALLDAAPKLKVVGRLGVGLDNIDMSACAARGIKVFPATGANNISVAEYVIASAMMLVRGAYHSTDEMVAGQWPRNALMGGEVFGRTLGLVGYGAIARETAVRASALGMQVCAFDPYLPEDSELWAGAERCSLEDLLSSTDILSLHVPLTDETRHLIDARALARLKSGAVVINAARGGIVDEHALASALRHDKLGGAALDVFENEPLKAGGAAQFEGLKNIILTPHIAGVTDESNVRVSRLTLENVFNALDADLAT